MNLSTRRISTHTVSRQLPWHRKRSCNRQVKSPDWQSRTVRQHWSGALADPAEGLSRPIVAAQTD
jgi:hypothetical protein